MQALERTPCLKQKYAVQRKRPCLCNSCIPSPQNTIHNAHLRASRVLSLTHRITTEYAFQHPSVLENGMKRYEKVLTINCPLSILNLLSNFLYLSLTVLHTFLNFLKLYQMFLNFLQLTFTRKSTRNTQNNSLNLLRTDPRGPRELREGPQGTPGTSTKQYGLVNFLNWSGASSCDGSTKEMACRSIVAPVPVQPTKWSPAAPSSG